MDFDSLKQYFNKDGYPGTTRDDLYLTIRYLSSVPESFLQAFSAASYFGRISPEILVKYLYSSISIQRPPWFNLVKKKKKNTEKIIPHIAKFYNCSHRHAEEILLIFKKNMIDPYSIFGLRKKE